MKSKDILFTYSNTLNLKYAVRAHKYIYTILNKIIMIKKFEEFVNESYGKEMPYVVRVLDNGQTVGDLPKEEFVNLLVNDIEVAKEAYKKDKGEDLIRIWWEMPHRGSSCSIYVKDDADDYIDTASSCYDDAAKAKSFTMSTGWSIVGNKIVFTVSEDIKTEDRRNLEKDMSKFYRGTTYFGD
jgi:hypothetical protein